jgi:hypothetical protein
MDIIALVTMSVALLADLLAPTRAETLSPSPGWERALPPGPDANVKITEAYARMVARDAYFWAWPK